MVRLAALMVWTTPAIALATPQETSLRGPQAASAAVEAAGARRGLALSDYYEPIGCYADSEESSVLTSPVTNKGMTTDGCYEYCHDMGAHFMATQYGKQCWCSRNSGLDYGVNGGGTCDMACGGDPNEICGGFYSFNLYRLLSADEPTDPEYVGCYADIPGRLMTDKIVNDGMTTAYCHDHCESKGSKYYATQYSDECFCGMSDEESDYTSAGGGTCHMRCAGNDAESCGGYFAFSLYKFADDDDDDDDDDDGDLPAPYGDTFTGDGTYYDETVLGNCGYVGDYPSIYANMEEMALNEAQYGNSEMCGACVQGKGTGGGAGFDPFPPSFIGFIQDQCPECNYGDLDQMTSTSEDGRWDIEWEFVKCPGVADVSFTFENTQQYYWKILVMGTLTPVTTMTINGMQGKRSSDNHFEFNGIDWEISQTVTITTLEGVESEHEVTAPSENYYQ